MDSLRSDWLRSPAPANLPQPSRPRGVLAAERRWESRLWTKLDAWLLDEQHDVQRVQAVNFSQTGVRLTLARPLAAGQSVQLGVSLDGQGFSTYGRVVWSEGAQAAVQFGRLTEFQSRALGRWLQEKRVQDWTLFEPR